MRGFDLSDGALDVLNRNASAIMERFFCALLSPKNYLTRTTDNFVDSFYKNFLLMITINFFAVMIDQINFPLHFQNKSLSDNTLIITCFCLLQFLIYFLSWRIFFNVKIDHIKLILSRLIVLNNIYMYILYTIPLIILQLTVINYNTVPEFTFLYIIIYLIISYFVFLYFHIIAWVEISEFNETPVSTTIFSFLFSLLFQILVSALVVSIFHHIEKNKMHAHYDLTSPVWVDLDNQNQIYSLQKENSHSARYEYYNPYENINKSNMNLRMYDEYGNLLYSPVPIKKPIMIVN